MTLCIWLRCFLYPKSSPSSSAPVDGQVITCREAARLHDALAGSLGWVRAVTCVSGGRL